MIFENKEFDRRIERWRTIRLGFRCFTINIATTRNARGIVSNQICCGPTHTHAHKYAHTNTHTHTYIHTHTYTHFSSSFFGQLVVLLTFFSVRSPSFLNFLKKMYCFMHLLCFPTKSASNTIIANLRHMVNGKELLVNNAVKFIQMFFQF